MRVPAIPPIVPITAAIIASAAVLAGSLAASVQPLSARPAPAVPTLDWTDCGDGFQCANARVPLDYDRPRGRTIEVALIRRLAFDQANRIGSLFVNPGGPGESGIEFVRTAPPPAFQVLSRFDVIGFDPRGLGASRPAVVDCGDNPSHVNPFLGLQTVIPRPQTVDKRAFLSATLSYGRNCRELNRKILPHLSSANVARDLDRGLAGERRRP